MLIVRGLRERILMPSLVILPGLCPSSSRPSATVRPLSGKSSLSRTRPATSRRWRATFPPPMTIPLTMARRKRRRLRRRRTPTHPRGTRVLSFFTLMLPGLMSRQLSLIWLLVRWLRRSPRTLRLFLTKNVNIGMRRLLRIRIVTRGRWRPTRESKLEFFVSSLLVCHTRSTSLWARGTGDFSGPSLEVSGNNICSSSQDIHEQGYKLIFHSISM
mmetsp:Transcript_13685/g.29632  ORF Transcript_13685/g.29632 Transcript_13685/m.29632 type:complete len:215 (-) Transcript_13685:70-714(-)